MRIFVVVAFLLVACSPGEGSDTTGADAGSDTTGGGAAEVPPTNEQDSGNGGSGSLGLPQECVDALVAYLQEIEPVVEDVDWENATLTELEELTDLENLGTEYTDEIDALDCDDADFEDDSDAAFQYIIDLAEDNAPGTVGYLEWIREFAGSFEDGDDDSGNGSSGVEPSGDCDTDIAAFQAIVDEGGTMEDLTLGEISGVTSLLSAISLECPPATSSEFFAKDDVSDFLGS